MEQNRKKILSLSLHSSQERTILNRKKEKILSFLDVITAVCQGKLHSNVTFTHKLYGDKGTYYDIMYIFG